MIWCHRLETLLLLFIYACQFDPTFHLSYKINRSKGERGADIDTLRGNKGADFESEAFVTRGKPIGLFSCFGFGRRSKKVYLLIKGPHIFVFANESASAPNYAIPLKHERVEVMDVKGDSQMVTLESSLGDVLYEFKFDLKENRELANNFGRVLEEQIAVGNVDEVKEVSCIDG